jgi:hypothetical protein
MDAGLAFSFGVSGREDQVGGITEEHSAHGSMRDSLLLTREPSIYISCPLQGRQWQSADSGSLP